MDFMRYQWERVLEVLQKTSAVKVWETLALIERLKVKLYKFLWKRSTQVIHLVTYIRVNTVNII